LNRYGITVDNAVALTGALYNIFTQTELFADPTRAAAAVVGKGIQVA
jgi:hypothetical protein